jgi:hypothetical protein
MAEKVAQHVRRDAFIGVPLGVAVPVGVGDHGEPVEDLLSLLSVLSGHRGGQQPGDGVDPLPVGVGERSLALGRGAA